MYSIYEEIKCKLVCPENRIYFDHMLKRGRELNQDNSRDIITKTYYEDGTKFLEIIYWKMKSHDQILNDLDQAKTEHYKPKMEKYDMKFFEKIAQHNAKALCGGFTDIVFPNNLNSIRGAARELGIGLHQVKFQNNYSDEYAYFGDDNVLYSFTNEGDDACLIGRV